MTTSGGMVARGGGSGAAASDLLVPWPLIRQGWRERNFGKLRELVQALEDVPLTPVERLLDVSRAPESGDRAAELIGEALDRAAVGAEGPLLLVTYLYGLCLDAWERTDDYETIGLVLEALGSAVKKRSSDGRLPDSELVSLVADQARCMVDAMGVEDGMNCSCPVEMGRRARGVVTQTAAVLEREESLAGGHAELREIVREDADIQHRYFLAVQEVADAVLEFLESDGRDSTALEHAIAALGETEQDASIQEDVYGTELRAHRATLGALRDHAALPRIRIDDANVVYLYPFALPATGDDVVAQTLAEASDWRFGHAELRPTNVQKLGLTDMWARPGSAPSYTGVSIELPPVTVITTAEHDPDRPEFPIDCDCEIRLSRLGNHHLRVRSRLEQATLHDVNQALRRGSSSMGTERLLHGEERTWGRFVEYADDVIRTLTKRFPGGAEEDVTASYHVLVAARAITIEYPDGTSAAATVDDLPTAVGATLLFHPVRQLTISLEEWIRYPPVAVDELNLLKKAGYADELALRTANSSILFTPASPDWAVREYEEMLEFVASIPPLLRAREQEAAKLGREIELGLAPRDASSGRPTETIHRLHDTELELRKLSGRIQEELAFFHSPVLCRTRAQREFLDDLWEAAGLPALEADLERRLDVISTQLERLSALVSDIAEENRRKERERHDAHARAERARQERVENYLRVLTGLIAAASLAGLFGFVNEEFAFDSAIAPAIEIGIIVVIAAAVLLFLVLRNRKAG
jgi:hypothetical protein